MKSYTGYEYLLIDAANQYGHDKMLFEDRIQWATDNLDILESLVNTAETKPLYMKAVQAIRKAQKGIPTGHLVGLDACCSGMQVLSTITGCVSGATMCGLVDPDVRADAYSKVTELMNELLHDQGITVDIPRKQAKEATMTVLYGSKAKPVEIFGEDTPEISAFYQAIVNGAPGAWSALQELLNAWQPWALYHAWKMPDGYDAKVKVMVPVMTKNKDGAKPGIRITVDELDKASFTYEYKENVGQPRGISLPANVTHACDSYILRCIHRRCNYDMATVLTAQEAMLEELDLRMQGFTDQVEYIITDKLSYYIDQYERSAMADVVILQWIRSGYDTQYLSTEHLKALTTIVESMLQYQPFEVVTVHDEFRVHANNCNHLRQQYINIFAELAESNIFSDILSQIYGQDVVFTKLSNNLGELIRGSNYALS